MSASPPAATLHHPHSALRVDPETKMRRLIERTLRAYTAFALPTNLLARGQISAPGRAKPRTGSASARTGQCRTKNSPTGARPHRRVLVALPEVSSMDTRRCGSCAMRGGRRVSQAPVPGLGLGLVRTANARAAVRPECPAAREANSRCGKSTEYALPMRHPLPEVNPPSRPVGTRRDSGQTRTAVTGC